MLYWPFWRWDDSQKDRYGTVGTGFGAGTGAGTVQVRVRYMGTVRVRYVGTVGTVHRYENRTHVPYPCPQRTVPTFERTKSTMYPNSGRNSSRSAAISAAIWVRVTFGTLKSGYGTLGTWVRYVGTVFVPMYRTNRTHVPYTRTVPVPYPCTVPVPYLYRIRTRTKTRTTRPVPV